MAKRAAVRKRGLADMAKKLPREVLKDIMKRAGMSGLEIAKQAGYNSASGFYRLMQPGVQEDRPISHEAMKRLIPVLRGRGNPPITIDELLAISDASPSMSPALAPALAQAVTRSVDHAELVRDTGGERLPIRLRVERGVYIVPGVSKMYGAALISPSREFRVGSQFVATVTDESALPTYRQGSQLHCVHPEEWASPERLVSKRVVAYASDGSNQYREIVIARVDRVEDGRAVLSDAHGDPVSGEIAGVVVGAYNRE